MRVIANPPMGVYKGDINIGQAFYHILLDVYYRHLSKSTSENVVFPAYSLNFHGKRGDTLFANGSQNQFSSEYIRSNRLRDRLNLGSNIILTDNSVESIESAQHIFRKLVEHRFALKDGEDWYLDIAKISQQHDLKGVADSISFYPDRVKRELERLIENNTQNHIKLTRSTKYSVPNPIEGRNLGPLYVLSTMWEGHYTDAKFTFAGSNNVLAKYIFLRFSIMTALTGEPGMDEVFVYNKIEPERGVQAWNISDLTTDLYETDMLRYALISGHSLTKQTVNMDLENLLKAGRRFVYKLGSTRQAFKELKIKADQPDNDYAKNMRSFQFNSILKSSEQKLTKIIHKINESKQRGTWEMNKERLCVEYLTLVSELRPMLPAITTLIRNEIGGEEN